MRLAAQLKKNLRDCIGIAAAIRVTTTENRKATPAEMIAAGRLIGLNASTVRIQFSKARREDAALDLFFNQPRIQS